MSSDYVQLLLEESHLAAHVFAALLEHRGLADRGQHHQQDDGAETAADAVEERQAEYLHFAALAHQGQSFAGMSSVPSVTRERCQNGARPAGRPPWATARSRSARARGAATPPSSKRRNPLAGIHVAPHPRGLALGRQAVGDQHDLVGLRAQSPRGRKCVVEAGAVGGRASRAPASRARALPRRAREQPPARAAAPGVESQDLVAAAGGYLRHEPVEIATLGAIWRRPLVRVVLVAQPDDRHQILVQHAGGDARAGSGCAYTRGEPGDVAGARRPFAAPAASGARSRLRPRADGCPPPASGCRLELSM